MNCLISKPGGLLLGQRKLELPPSGTFIICTLRGAREAGKVKERDGQVQKNNYDRSNIKMITYGLEKRQKKWIVVFINYVK
jgi:hypothetical protein